MNFFGVKFDKIAVRGRSTQFADLREGAAGESSREALRKVGLERRK